MSEPTPPASAAPAVPPGRPGPSPTLLRLTIAAVVLIALAALFWPRGQGSFVAPGGFLVDGNGRPAPMAQHMTPATLVHFWATWCPPCVQEAPWLDRLERDLATPGQFEVLRIAVADEPQKVKVFLGDRAATVLYDPQWDVAHRYGTSQLPETYLVVNGKVVRKWIGATDWGDPKVRAELAAKLAEGGITLAAHPAG
ncbi:MAG: TlpA family protein disulfide reductase [Acidobacteriota bacterium]